MNQFDREPQGDSSSVEQISSPKELAKITPEAEQLQKRVNTLFTHLREKQASYIEQLDNFFTQRRGTN